MVGRLAEPLSLFAHPALKGLLFGLSIFMVIYFSILIVQFLFNFTRKRYTKLKLNEDEEEDEDVKILFKKQYGTFDKNYEVWVEEDAPKDKEGETIKRSADYELQGD